MKTHNFIFGMMIILSSVVICQQKTGTELKGIDDLDKYIQNLEKTSEFSGDVLIAKDGKKIFEKAYGLASKKYEVRNNLDTKFNIGSISKHITSIAILQLLEKGLIGMDDPIGKYIEGFPEKIASQVTIKHLVTMASGWGDYWDNSEYRLNRYEMRKVSDYISFIKNIPLNFEPGSKMEHCNTGYEVAGAIIEKVTGMNYYDYVRENIYKPAGMLNSDSYDIDGPVQNIAEGYTNEHPDDIEKKGYKWSNTYLRLPAKGTPTGGSYSTINDLLKLDQAQRNFTLIGKDYTNYLLNLFQGKLGDPFKMKKGIMHVIGGAEGVGAVLGLDMMDDDMKKGYSIVILSNYDLAAAIDLYEKIKKLVLTLKKK